MLSKLLITCFLALAFTSSSCGQQPTQYFPAQVRTTKTAPHQRVLGTKVSGIFPASYQYIKQLARYQKSDALYVQVLEATTRSFEQVKPTLTRQAMEAKGAQVEVVVPTRVNNYEAVYIEGPSKQPGETKLILAFGDNTFLVMATGVVETANMAGRAELKKILQTLYYEASLTLNPLELANFTFDQTLTHFAYATTLSNFFVYAEHGLADVNKPLANSMQFGVLPKMAASNSEAFAQEVLLRYERQGVTLDTKTLTQTTINRYPAWVVASKIHQHGKEGILYQALLVGEKSSVLFSATAYTNPTTYLDLFKRTAATIHLD